MDLCYLDHWIAAWMVTWLTNWVGCLYGGLCKLDCPVPLWIRGFTMCMIAEQDQVIIFCTYHFCGCSFTATGT